MRLRHPPDRHIVSISAVSCRGLIYLTISPRSFPPSEKGDPVNTAEKHNFFFFSLMWGGFIRRKLFMLPRHMMGALSHPEPWMCSLETHNSPPKRSNMKNPGFYFMLRTVLMPFLCALQILHLPVVVFFKGYISKFWLKLC